MQNVTLLLLFILWVNFLPPLSSQFCYGRAGWPLDFGLKWFDGNPLLGAHKTIRGAVAALVGSILFVPILGLDWQIIIGAAALVVAGDLMTSFIKRRLRHESGQVIFGLDQFLESLLPALWLGPHLGLTWQQICLVLTIFIPLSFSGSILWQYLTYRPSTKNMLRIVRSSARLRSWRACHQPLVRWQVLLNFEHFLYYHILLNCFFKVTGLYQQGVANALKVCRVRETFYFDDLPEPFDGFTILFLSDLHLDSIPQLTDRIIDAVSDLRVDLCLLGGDYRMELYGSYTAAIRCLRRLRAQIHARNGVLGVLGNHDCIEMLPDLEDAEVVMLVNDSWYIEKDWARLYIVGVDDPHYYKVHDLENAFRDVPEQAWTIFLAHSPEVYREVAQFHPHLYLCGHTHGGQVCLPGERPVFTHCRAPRFTAAGHWAYKGMRGYTSCGVGPSGVPVRFHCPGEITLITLRKGKGREEKETVDSLAMVRNKRLGVPLLAPGG